MLKWSRFMLFYPAQSADQRMCWLQARSCLGFCYTITLRTLISQKCSMTMIYKDNLEIKICLQILRFMSKGLKTITVLLKRVARRLVYLHRVLSPFLCCSIISPCGVLRNCVCFTYFFTDMKVLTMYSSY